LTNVRRVPVREENGEIALDCDSEVFAYRLR
jgi:hypothetical protein